MAKGTTRSGFEYDINPDHFKDARFLMMFAKAKRKGDDMEYLPLLEVLLGEDGYEKLCRHCEDENGISLVTKVLAEFKEILAEVMKDNDAKN